jgi:hypothetical protein
MLLLGEADVSNPVKNEDPAVSIVWAETLKSIISLTPLFSWGLYVIIRVSPEMAK